jgi:hypothetical protein
MTSSTDILSLPEIGNPAERRLCLLLPQYKSTHPLTLYSILAVWDRRRMSCMMHYNDAVLVHSRNMLAHQFMTATTAEWALFVDDDMILPTGNQAWMDATTGMTLPECMHKTNVVDRLLSHNKTLVGAVAYSRSIHGTGKPCFQEAHDDPKVLRKVRTRALVGLQVTGWVGTGCLLVHRNVFMGIQQRFPHLGPSATSSIWQYFTPSNDYAAELIRSAAEAPTEAERQSLLNGWDPAKGLGQAYSGEDVVFCRRARAAGHQPYVDLDCICGHIGSIIWSSETIKE